MKNDLPAKMPVPERILVVETLYLGDLIHTLPLIAALRVRYPSARLDVLVRAAHVPLMSLVDGIDRVLAMSPSQHRGVTDLLGLCRHLREQGYDLVLNPGASDRATLLTWLSGGRYRIGRLNRKQSHRLMPWLHDQLIDYPWGGEPMYLQKLQAFAPRLGLSSEIRFCLQPSDVDLDRFALPKKYLHVSPCASECIRSLPAATVVTLMEDLNRRYPDIAIVVSCGPSPREQRQLALIREGLSFATAVFLPGAATLNELAALIGGAALHIGPDSGPLHLARALGTPAVACFLFKDASVEWMPVGHRYRTVGVTTRFQGGLYGLSVPDILAAADTLIGPSDPCAES